MSRSLYRLPPNAATAITQPGRHADGGNLYLAIDKTGRRRSWVFLYSFDGRQREAGLGVAGAHGVTLKAARLTAQEMRTLLTSGSDPLAQRRSPEPKTVPVFATAAADYIATHIGSWSSPKHRYTWAHTTTEYCKPIAHTPVDQIDTEAVLKVLKPLWNRAPETASRLRGRIEKVLNAARALGHIDKDRANPARWKDHLDELLPKRDALSREHYAALPYEDVPAFVDRLRGVKGVSALALEFVILTATRTRETLGARFDEIDLSARVWTIPKTRTKTKIEHRVPLSPRAIEIVTAQQAKGGAFVFPGQYPNTHLTQAAMLMILRGLDVKVTVHGFRSSFRDWCGNETAYPREIAEHALGHLVGSKVERAYRRGDALERRRALMDAWCAYICGGADDASNVVELRRAAE
jgi:integrase